MRGFPQQTRILVDERQLLDLFEVLILDDIGYLQQNQEEMEVLFTLLAERYERQSTVITSNLVFSDWESELQKPPHHDGRHRLGRAPFGDP